VLLSGLAPFFSRTPTQSVSDFGGKAMGLLVSIAFQVACLCIIFWTTWRVLHRKPTHWAWKLLASISFPFATFSLWALYAIFAKESGLMPELSGEWLFNRMQLTVLLCWVPFVAFLFLAPRIESLKPDQT
jgi:hypothetical protein